MFLSYVLLIMRGCIALLPQPDFKKENDDGNLSLRIPTPLFGAGLIEAIDENTIIANMNANDAAKDALGIGGKPNRSGNDGTITRFGWKAQNKSLLMFAGEAYNVEMGVTNELMPNERGYPPNPIPTQCLFNPVPEDLTVASPSTVDPLSSLATSSSLCSSCGFSTSRSRIRMVSSGTLL